MKRKIIPDPLMMLITILVIIGFQVYWLADNYEREKRSMQIKINVAFQETVRQLQTAKLRLPGNMMTGIGQKEKTRIFIDEDINQDGDNVKSHPGRQVITMVNALRNRAFDSTGTNSTFKSTIVIVGRDSHEIRKDSLPLKLRKFADSDHFYNILYRVDSLQDSIKLPEIINKYSAELKRENIDVGFSITKSPGALPEDEDDMSKVIVGFAHPVTYHLLLVDTTPYLLRKISLPILFSFLLIGITILSFVLLYRNLLRQQRLAEIKNEFISNITHELKTPIATVGVAIEALKNFNAIHDKQKTKEYLEISSSELQRLSLLVDKVLKLSMFEKKEIELNKEDFNLKALISEVLDTMKPQFEKQDADITFKTEGENFIMNGDKLHITSVIYNLFDNALKYSKGDPIIKVELYLKKNIFELKVSDNGIGIANEYRRKIFDKFFRIPTGDTHAVKGYGLGLSYVSEILKRHMGFIYVESELGKGSTFIAKFPAEEASTVWFDDKRRIHKISVKKKFPF